ncbi:MULTISPECIES: hypothetical protein [unclassified Haladaptatus]|uniref:hypothetical protein n=1 Tax=unclassified Haladaptatus TaxID=2622732 RepID=UPI002FCDF963
MSSPLENPALRYGIGLSSAVAIALVAFLFLHGTVQLVAYGMAVLEAVAVPQFLKLSATQ